MTPLDDHICQALVAHNTAVATIEAMYTAAGCTADKTSHRAAIDKLSETCVRLMYHLAMRQQQLDEGMTDADYERPLMVGNNGFSARIYEIGGEATLEQQAIINDMVADVTAGIVEPYDERPYIHNRWGLADGGL